MTKEIERMLGDYELSCKILAEAFLNKQWGEKDEPRLTIDGQWAWWFADIVGGSLVYADIMVSFDDIIVDLKEDAPKDEIVRYTDYINRCVIFGLTRMNYHSWLHGAPRHTEAEFEAARQALERRQRRNDINLNTSYDNDGD